MKYGVQAAPLSEAIHVGRLNKECTRFLDKEDHTGAVFGAVSEFVQRHHGGGVVFTNGENTVTVQVRAITGGHLDMLPPEIAEHWEASQADRERSGDRGCACMACRIIPLMIMQRERIALWLASEEALEVAQGEPTLADALAALAANVTA